MSKADSYNALRYYNGFRKLILLRRETITLEKMAQLINDMAEASAGWVKVTPEQLRDLESDRYHGMSLIAVMYARFFGHNIAVTKPGKEAPVRLHDDETIIANRRSERVSLGKRLDKNYARLSMAYKLKKEVTGIYVSYVEAGNKRQCYFKISHEDPGFKLIYEAIGEHVVDRAVAARKTCDAKAEKDILVAAKLRRPKARKNSEHRSP